jgi:hypothetical protein
LACLAWQRATMRATPQQSGGRRSTGSRRVGGTGQRRPWPPGPQSSTMPPPSLASDGFLPGALHGSDGRRGGSGHGGTGSARSAGVGLLQRGRPSRQSLDQRPSPTSAREEERERPSARSPVAVAGWRGRVRSCCLRTRRGQTASRVLATRGPRTHPQGRAGPTPSRRGAPALMSRAGGGHSLHAAALRPSPMGCLALAATEPRQVCPRLCAARGKRRGSGERLCRSRV